LGNRGKNAQAQRITQSFYSANNIHGCDQIYIAIYRLLDIRARQCD
jgi:hypothetical protein